LHVVDDDQPTNVVEQEIRQATELVKAKASELRGTAGEEPVTIVKAGDPFQAIVQVATEANVDLVAMGAHRRRILRDVFVGTTIERVMRTGPHPVLMVNREPKGPYRRVVAAIDMSEASANALGSAKSLGLLDSAHVSLVHAFEPFAKGLLIYANIEREKIEAHVAQETTQTRRKLIDFVTNLQLGELTYDLCLEDGPTFRAIRDFVDKKQPERLAAVASGGIWSSAGSATSLLPAHRTAGNARRPPGRQRHEAPPSGDRWGHGPGPRRHRPGTRAVRHRDHADPGPDHRRLLHHHERGRRPRPRRSASPSTSRGRRSSSRCCRCRCSTPSSPVAPTPS
jgi:universal stress protein E